MQMFDNINTFVKDDLKQEIRAGSKVSIAAACFSIYAYQELKEQLSDGCDEFFVRFEIWMLSARLYLIVKDPLSV